MTGWTKSILAVLGLALTVMVAKDWSAVMELPLAS